MIQVGLASPGNYYFSPTSHGTEGLQKGRSSPGTGRWPGMGQLPANWPRMGQLPAIWPDRDEPPARPLTAPWAITPNWPLVSQQLTYQPSPTAIKGEY
jgi:hypothetical protein